MEYISSILTNSFADPLFLIKTIFFLLIILFTSIFIIIPFVLGEITRWKFTKDEWLHRFNSSLYVGRVWHTRYVPTVHSFTYPLFLFVLDLQEVDATTTKSIFENVLYPLNYIMNFRPSDHLINGEGEEKEKKVDKKVTSKQQQNPHYKESENKKRDSINAITNGDKKRLTLSERIINLCKEKTNNKFQPSLETHNVYLVTHLSYYGYCFNPVSFYYLREKNNEETISAIVAEVSNTPWVEMHCYVLHPDSIDNVTKAMENNDNINPIINYKFPKTFHVSPFMEMDYTYDWKFNTALMKNTISHEKTQKMKENDLKAGIMADDIKSTHKEVVSNDDDNTENNSYLQNKRCLPLFITTKMKKGNITHFSATMQVFRKSIYPPTLSWQLIQFPIYCMIIQIWIHIEAFFLFAKGVAFIPHPEESETTVSKCIAAIMTPLFAAYDYYNNTFGEGGTTSNGNRENGVVTSKIKSS